MSATAVFYNISPGAITKARNGIYKSAAKHIWRYKGEAFDKYEIPKFETYEMIPGEIFIRIDGSVAEVSNKGRVRSTARYRELYKIDKKGFVTLRINGKRTMRKVSHLVAEAFIRNPKNMCGVGFKDGDETNRCVENLYWTKR